MTQFSDPLYLGAGPTNITSNNNGGVGVGPCNAIFVYDIVPLTIGTTNLATAQTTAGAANLTLTAGTGTTSVVRPDGVTVVQFDVPRAVSLTSTGVISGVTFTVSGYDVYGQPMTEAITGPSNSTVTGAKAFYQIASIAASGAVGTNTSAGTSDKFGLPFVVSQGYVNHISWNGALARDAGTFVAAVTTDPATSTTGDVRGTYVPSSGASDGAKRLVFTIAFSAAQLNNNATRALTLGVTQA